MTSDPIVPSRLTCAEVEPLLPLVADGALDDRGDPDLFLHLVDCDHCQAVLASHDLLTLTLERTPTVPVERVIRWRIPVALAASVLAAAVTGWLWIPGPVSGEATSAVAVATPKSTPASAAPTAVVPLPDNPVIEIDVAAVPSPIPGRTMFVVRRGEQVLLVDPVAGTAQPPPTDAKPATYHRY